MTNFWLFFWAIFLATAWLLPNHYLPWSSFHTDALAAVAFSLAAVFAAIRFTSPIVWHRITLLVFIATFIPAIQYNHGLVMLTGTAWMGSAYLLGFSIALLTGASWERSSSGQLADGLFFAIGIAAILSVGLQLEQWLDLDINAWSMGGGPRRPYANFGQPNQLGTFLLWGILASMWGLVRQRIGMWTSILMSAFLLFGIALTQSRTAWVAVVILVAVNWMWRGLWPDRRWSWIATGLGLFFVGCVISIGWLNQLLSISASVDIGDVARILSEQRPTVWIMFIDAALKEPWFGYGWDQVQLAHLAVAIDHPSLLILFSHSHNLFLDLILWCGIPLGLFISISLLQWLWQVFIKVRSLEEAILLLFLLIIGNHAMLELPLYYAYFLLPTGLVIGMLNEKLQFIPVFKVGRWSIFALLIASSTLLTMIIRDYLKVADSYQTLRFEWSNIQVLESTEPPEILLIDQWQEFIRVARFKPSAGMSADDLTRMRNVTSLYPSTGAILKLAAALAMNQHPGEAQRWLELVCKVTTPKNCQGAQAVWASQSRQNTAVAAIPWPH